LGIAYQDVTYQSPLGTMHAWRIPPPTGGTKAATTWTIGVHGIGGDKAEMLRFVKPVVAAGNTMLIINYRNDTGNPRSPDNINHLSDSEWQDLQAAVRYAKAQGATDIRLYGDSLGGSIVESYLTQSSDVANTDISRVVLDSPALDWKAAIKSQLSLGGYPTILYYPTSTVLTLRTGIHVSTISTTAKEIKHKTLIIHNSEDKTIPLIGSKQLAAARPDLITLVDVGGGGHVRSWNYDQQRYEKTVTDFLVK
jgi:predicted alpha/beta-fold hydrolase